MQTIDLYQPIAGAGPAPLVIRALVTPRTEHMVGGVPPNQTKVENYVLLSAMPDELKRRIEMAVQALLSGA